MIRALARLLGAYLVACGVIVNLVAFTVLIFDWIHPAPLVETAADRARSALGRALVEYQPFFGWSTGLSPAQPAASLFERAGVPDEFDVVTPSLDEWPAPPAQGRVWEVGVAREYARPSQVARLVRQGDVVNIDPGMYAGDTAVWTADDLTLRGAGGMVWLDARDTPLPEAKAIWVLKGRNTRVENIGFLNAVSPDRNGAGIRQEGDKAWVRNCYFAGNESGYMSSNRATNRIVIEHSEFFRNGHPNGQAHNIYIGAIARFTLRFSYVHAARSGSEVKTRARENIIEYNRIANEAGNGNYEIDLSNGGRALILGNLIQQSPQGNNHHLITFAPEGGRGELDELFVVNNTLLNLRANGVFVGGRITRAAQVYNNVFKGAGRIVNGPALLAGNAVARPSSWLDAVRGFQADMGGVEGSAGNVRVRFEPGIGEFDPEPPGGALGAARDLGVDVAAVLRPQYEYLHPRRGRPRPTQGRVDAGAREQP